MPESSQIPTPKPWAFLVEYLPAVLRRWVALMTGSLPVAIYEIVAALPGDQHPWNHPPPWVIWLSVLLAAVTAQFFTWRDVRHALFVANTKVRDLEAQLVAAPVFTSDGLSWETLGSKLVTGTEFNGLANTVNIMPVKPGVDRLPQPLILRVQCLREPRRVSAVYTEDFADMNPQHRHCVPDNLISFEGKSVYVKLIEPRFMLRAVLAVTIFGHSAEEVTVERVEHPVSEVGRFRPASPLPAPPPADPPSSKASG
jgi:hypothetical protein